MGAASRHTIPLPAHLAARVWLLVIFSDGKADEFDGCYRASYDNGDSRWAKTGEVLGGLAYRQLA